jgi:LacI family transcriptional regulator
VIQLGHRKIAYFGGVGQTYVRQERMRGYCEAISEHDLEPPIIWDCEDTKLAASEAMVKLLQAHPDITAIMCNGDRVALGACLSLVHQNKIAGRDISVIGIDDITDAALASPPLSTMAVSPTELGRQLGRVMINRINYPEQQQVYVDITAELVIRQTTGSPVQR